MFPTVVLHLFVCIFNSNLSLYEPYWHLISQVLNFVILARQYFAGFYFRNFNRQI